MGKKRKHRKKNKKIEKDESVRQDLLDELLALEAVFAEDLILIRNEGYFDINIVPHPSDAEANHVSLTLRVGYNKGYPEKPPDLEITQSSGISETEVDALFEHLDHLASELAGEGDVFLFMLIDQCQEELRLLNEAIIQEQKKESDDSHKSIRFDELSIGLNRKLSGGFAYGLYSEDYLTESPLTPKPRQTSMLRSMETIEGKVLPVGQSVKDKPKLSTPKKSGKELDGQISGTGVSTSMLSRVASMVEKMGPLPTAIVTYLGLAETYGDSEEEGSMLKTEVLVGHLLRLLASGTTGSSFQKQSFPFLCAELHEKGILPRWLHWMLIHKPMIFERIFKKVFHKEIEFIRKKELTDNHTRQLRLFWLFSEKDEISDANQNAMSTSRYKTDFEEIKIFGKGGFGIVVGAVNRLDGRQYAIKKIKLVATSLDAYTKIIREVSTLARLQHPNVVRYFQAWLEPAHDDDDLGSEDSMDLDALIETLSVDSTSEETTTFTVQISRKNKTKHLPVLSEVSKSDSEFLSASSTSPAVNQSLLAKKTLVSHVVFESGSDPRSQDISVLEEQEKVVQHQILYIQMEACHRTLHQMLESKTQLAEEERWEILRQILRGLSYIHSQRIIHRDLKPPNIFYSASGEVKLGDFGLAKFSTTTGDSIRDGSHGFETQLPHTPSKQTTTIESSGVCGTSLYIAPEIENHWPTYDSKVDMYSLGIVVFELWHPFSTSMERILTLKELKEKGQLPNDWQKENPQVATLVLWLLSRNPARRPTAKEVLRSDALPARVADEQVQDLIRSFKDDSETYDRIIEGIFKSSQASKKAENQSIVISDLVGAPLFHPPEQIQLQDQLIQLIKEIFERHGILQMTSQDVGFCQDQFSQNMVRVMSSSGDLYSFKHEMRTPFVEWLVHEIEKSESTKLERSFEDEPFTIESLRRYDLDWISTEDDGLGLRKKSLQADIDFITSPLPRITESTLKDPILVESLLSEQLLPEAEVLKLITEVMNCFDFPKEKGNMEIRLTHLALLHYCLKEVALEKSILSQTIDLLSTVRKYSPLGSQRHENWTSVEKALEGLGLSSSQLRNLKRFLTKLTGFSSAVIPELTSAIANASQKQWVAATKLALEEISTLVRLLEKWGVSKNQIIVEPLMTPKTDYYSGIYFEVYLMHPIKRTGNLFAFGGRYDALLDAVWKRKSRSSVNVGYGLVGGTLKLDSFVQMKLDSLQKSSKRSSNSDVLVCAKDGTLSSLSRRMRLISELWNHGIKAEMLHRVNPTLTAQYDHAAVSGIRILVILEEPEEFSLSDLVKVKNLDRKQEDIVPFKDVPAFVLTLLQNRISCGK